MIKQILGKLWALSKKGMRDLVIWCTEKAEDLSYIAQVPRRQRQGLGECDELSTVGEDQA